MGQARRRLRSMIAQHPLCIFCGLNPATTEDHQPARALFDRKEWPEGYVFPACEPCNQSSKHDEHILSLLVRFDSGREDDPQRRSDFVKYAKAMRNNFPDVIRFLSANEKRKFLKSERLRLSPGAALADLHIAGIAADDADRAFGLVLRKIMRALHWKHTGKIAPPDDRFSRVNWYTNAYLHVLHESGDFDLFSKLPARPIIARARRDLSDQFVYRYGDGGGLGLSPDVPSLGNRDGAGGAIRFVPRGLGKLTTLVRSVAGMFSISKAGTTRSPVVIVGPLALKFAKNEQGRIGNLYEANLYRTSNEERRALLCPVLWVASHGAILAMRAAVPLREMMSCEEYLEMGSRWRDAALDAVPDPFEPGARNWGRLDGRLVALDYAIHAWDEDSDSFNASRSGPGPVVL